MPCMPCMPVFLASFHSSLQYPEDVLLLAGADLQQQYLTAAQLVCVLAIKREREVAVLDLQLVQGVALPLALIG